MRTLLMFLCLSQDSASQHAMAFACLGTWLHTTSPLIAAIYLPSLLIRITPNPVFRGRGQRQLGTERTPPVRKGCYMEQPLPLSLFLSED